MQRGTSPSEANDKTNNQPHIVIFSDDNEDVTKQYFIAVEQDLMMETSTSLAALFFLFAAHYVFNLSYHTKVKECMQFLQQKVFALPSPNLRRSATTVAAIAGISRYYSEDGDSNNA